MRRSREARLLGTCTDATTARVGSVTRVLMFADYYVPAVRAGGPPASLQGLLTSSDLQISLICRDRDLDSTRSFGPAFSGPVQRDGHTVFYADLTSTHGRRSALRWVLAQKVDIVHLNSFHSRYFTVAPLIMRLLGRFDGAPVTISPRGEFNPSARRLGSRLKGLYAWAWRVLGIPKRIVWIAVSPKECDEIRQMWGGRCRIELVPSTGASEVRILDVVSRGSAGPGPRRVTFVGRVAPIKGLLEGLIALRSVSGPIDFDIFGPLEDAPYWRRCRTVIETLPPDVRVRYAGTLPRAEVGPVLARSDALLLPTYSENFGHTIYESLAHSCPVIVGADTPWTGYLGDGAGWVVQPQSIGSISAALSDLMTSAPDELVGRRRAALAAVRAWQARIDSSTTFDEVCRRIVESRGADQPGNSLGRR